MLYGIEAMHKKRIMHRDIKPENIIFKYNIPGNYHCVLAGNFLFYLYIYKFTIIFIKIYRHIQFMLKIY